MSEPREKYDYFGSFLERLNASEPASERIAQLEARLAEARQVLRVIEEPMHFDEVEAILDDRVRMQAAARAWLAKDARAEAGT